MRFHRVPFAIGALALLASSATNSLEAAPTSNLLPPAGNYGVEIVAENSRQWTGLTVSANGRFFVNFPRWSDDVPVSVAELDPRTGKLTPYPDTAWNAFAKGAAPQDQFVCVQSVVADDRGLLWALDAGNPKFAGVIAGSSKIVAIDLAKNRVKRVIAVKPPVITPQSYLNDLRIDHATGFMYITDSGTGALVVVEVKSGRQRRVLFGHPSTQWERTTLIIDGKPWLREGQPPRVHSDGIALTPDRKYLYYQALSGRTLSRIPTAVLRDFNLPEEQVAAAVETVGRTGAADGIMFDAQGNLHLSALEANAIYRLTPAGRLEVVVHDDRLISWPDTFAIGPEGTVYFTTTQIQHGANPPAPYRIFKIVRR